MSTAPAVNPMYALMELAADCSYDPLAFANGFWPERAPRQWQANILAYLTERLTNPATRHDHIQIAVSSGHGIGKSAFMGVITTWAMSCHAHCRGTITAGSGKQLETKTRPEIGKWIRASLAESWFDIKAESIRSTQTNAPDSWRMDFVTWSKEQTEPFQGLHNLDRIILVIFDEASAIADEVWDATEGALTDEGTIIIWLAFGNPTKNTGRFRQCFGNLAHRWKTFQIDSRTVEGTDKEQIAKWQEDYGEDSDFFRVRVRGEFPRAGSNQFISSESVEACRKFKAEGYQHLPKILAIDVARFGEDKTVIASRQGRKVVILKKVRGFDTVQSSNLLVEQIKQQNPDAVIVDADGIGGGVVDYVRALGYKVFEFHGGLRANDSVQYVNRRTEIWGQMREALTGPLDIPDDPELAADLTGPEYGFSNKQQTVLEKKEDMKLRGLESPDLGDAVAMTFAVPVAPKEPEPEPYRPASVWS